MRYSVMAGCAYAAALVCLHAPAQAAPARGIPASRPRPVFEVQPVDKSSQINPGDVWLDTSGNVIQAHGGGIIKVGKTYYWFGEDKTHGGHFQNVTCYSSNDLMHWTFRSDALTLQASGDLGPDRIIERPKVLYNRATRTYVMYMHVDSANYREAKVGVAISKKVEGPYEYQGSFRPLDHQSRDMTVFEDDDHTAYLIFEDRESGVRIAKLTPDYLKVESSVALIPHAYEAPAVVKIGKMYFLLGSFLTGWDLNANQYATAPSLAGPWSEFRDVAPRDTKTYQSQTTFILPVNGRHGTKYVYLGDRWRPHDLADSRYVWLPLQVKGDSLWLPSDAPWTMDDLRSGKLDAK